MSNFLYSLHGPHLCASRLLATGTFTLAPTSTWRPEESVQMSPENLLLTKSSGNFPLCYHFWSSSLNYSHLFVAHILGISFHDFPIVGTTLVGKVLLARGNFPWEAQWCIHGPHLCASRLLATGTFTLAPTSTWRPEESVQMSPENLLLTKSSGNFPLCYHFWSSSLNYSHLFVAHILGISFHDFPIVGTTLVGKVLLARGNFPWEAQWCNLA